MSDYSDFPWRPGMVNTYGWRVRTVRAGGIAFVADGYPVPSVRRFTGDEVPDLTDPATVGALAGAVREAWNRRGLYARPNWGTPTTGWHVLSEQGAWLLPHGMSDHVRTEGEAWLAAWHARPKEGA